MHHGRIGVLLRRGGVVGCLFALCWNATASLAEAPTNSPATAQPVPRVADQRRAAAEVEEIYHDSIAHATGADQKLTLARRMLDDAAATSKDPAGKYALLVRARDLAAQAGDLTTADQATRQIGAAYDVDLPRFQADCAEAVAKSLHTPAARAKFVAEASPLVDDAVRSERYDVGRRLSALITSEAAISDDLAARKRAADVARELRSSETAFAQVKGALAALAKDPNDPAANLKVGEFRCFVCGDWKAGLSLIAKGDDEPLKSLASRDLAGAADAGAQLALADAWWDAAAGRSPQAVANIHRHAAQWYYEAAPRLSGLAKARATERSAGVSESSVAVRTDTARSLKYDWSDPNQLDDWKTVWGNPVITPAGLQNREKSVRIQLKKPVEARMLTIDFARLTGPAFLVDWGSVRYRFRLDASFVDVSEKGHDSPGDRLKLAFPKNQSFELKAFPNAAGLAVIAIGKMSVTTSVKFDGGDFGITIDEPGVALRKIQFDR